MPPRRPEQPVIFIVDEDCGRHVADAIVEAGGQAKLLSDLVPRGTLDVDWIPRVSEWGAALITRDNATRRVPAERAALLSSGVHGFIIRMNGLKIDEVKAAVSLRYAAMLRYVKNDGVPFLARVTRTGVEVICTEGRVKRKRDA